MIFQCIVEVSRGHNSCYVTVLVLKEVLQGLLVGTDLLSKLGLRVTTFYI